MARRSEDAKKYTIARPTRGRRDTLASGVPTNEHTRQRVGSALVSVSYDNFEGEKLDAFLTFASEMFDVCYILANAGLQTYGEVKPTDPLFKEMYNLRVEDGRKWIERCSSRIDRLGSILDKVNGIYSGKAAYSLERRQKEFMHHCTFVLIPWDIWQKQKAFEQCEAMIEWLLDNSGKLSSLSENYKRCANDCKEDGDDLSEEQDLIKKQENLNKIADVLNLASQLKAAHEKSSIEYTRRHKEETLSKVYLTKECAAMVLWPRCFMLYPGGQTDVLKCIEDLCNAGFFEMASLKDGELIIDESKVGDRSQQLRWISLKYQEKVIGDPESVVDNFYGQPGYEDTAVLNFPPSIFERLEPHSDDRRPYYVVVQDLEEIEGKNLAALTLQEQQELLKQPQEPPSISDATIRRSSLPTNLSLFPLPKRGTQNGVIEVGKQYALRN